MGGTRTAFLRRKRCGDISESSARGSCSAMRNQDPASPLRAAGSRLCPPPPGQPASGSRCSHGWRSQTALGCTRRGGSPMGSSEFCRTKQNFCMGVRGRSPRFLARPGQDSETGEACPGPDSSFTSQLSVLKSPHSSARCPPRIPPSGAGAPGPAPHNDSEDAARGLNTPKTHSRRAGGLAPRAVSLLTLRLPHCSVGRSNWKFTGLFF